MGGPGSYLIGQEEIDEVLEVLRSGLLNRYSTYSLGLEEGWPDDDPRFKAKVYQLEQSFAQLCDTGFAVAVNSGTTALWVALMGLGIGPGDEVIVPGYTFIASMSSVAYARATPVLAEIDETLNLDPADVESRITPRTKAIMAVHMLGNPARMKELAEIADRHDLILLEDCAQALGARYHGHPVGSMGAAGTFSFNNFKTLTAGDGGMIVTKDESLYKRFFALHDQGHSPLRRGIEVGARPFLGLDFRMIEVQAAILIAQLRKLESIVSRLHTMKDAFKSRIADLPGIGFRELTDDAGETATLLTVLFQTPQLAADVSTKLSSKVIAASGWHVYSNMENLLDQRMVNPVGCPFACPSFPNSGLEYRRGMLPRTDDLLGRAMNISIGVVDRGLGAGFGVRITDDDATVEQRADEFRSAYLASC
jgi:dTDP-4-amino-4,6-dideoxygalactose transaminase